MPPERPKFERKTPPGRERVSLGYQCRPIWVTDPTKVVDDVEHRVVDEPIGGKDVPAAGGEARAVHGRHAAACFRYDERTAGNVPRLEVAFPETVEPPRPIG